jgi:hypothetical protein
MGEGSLFVRTVVQCVQRKTGGDWDCEAFGVYRQAYTSEEAHQYLGDDISRFTTLTKQRLVARVGSLNVIGQEFECPPLVSDHQRP